MMNRAAYAISLWLSFMCGTASGATFTYLVGDDDGFGGQLPADNRSAAEAASTDGAQFTDFSETGYGTFAFSGQDPVFFNGIATAAPAGPDSLFVTFNIDMFDTISSIDVSMFTLGIQDNFPTSATGGGDQLLFDNALVDGFFDGIDQDGFPIGTSGLVSGAIAPSLFTNALDGEVILKILLNSTTVNLSDGSITIGFNNPNGEPAAFDYFKLTISGTLATIPAPAAIWLFGSGLLGFVGLAKRKKP